MTFRLRIRKPALRNKSCGVDAGPLGGAGHEALRQRQFTSPLSPESSHSANRADPAERLTLFEHILNDHVPNLSGLP